MTAKILKLIATGVATTLMSGCIVLSVYPFYTPKDLIFDPGMAGTWAKAGASNETWQFTAPGKKSYVLMTTDDNSTNGFYAHLFKLKNYQFLDLLPTNHNVDFYMPVHLITRVTRTETNLTLQFLDFGWLAKLLENNPDAIRHIIVPEHPDETNRGNMLYLTASTSDLQKFLLKHAADTNAFSSDSAVQLVRPAQ